MNNIVIIGGGAAGTAVALTLARVGLQPTILENHPQPIWKIGEGLPPNATPILHRLGLLAPLQQAGVHLPAYGHEATWGSDTLRLDPFLHHLTPTHGTTQGWHLDRTAFETLLKEQAQQAGVQWLAGHKLLACQWHTDHWQMTVKQQNRTETLTSRFMVDATGRSAAVGRACGAEWVAFDRLVGIVAVLEPVDNPLQDSTTRVTAVPDGWWYSSVLANGRLILAYMTDSDLIGASQTPAIWWEMASQTTQWERAQQYQPPTTLRTYPARTATLSQVVGQNWLAVGDAAISYDPLASYGITAALGSGYYAGCAIADHLAGEADALPAYEALLQTTFAQYWQQYQQIYSLERRWAERPFWKRRTSTK